MPSRILKDSILTDKAFNSLTMTEESIYHRLLVSADDYGVFYADPLLLLRILYPRRTDITEEAVRESLDHLEAAGFISRYTAEGDDYLQICSWEKTQRLRNTRHKFPTPEGTEEPPAAPEAEAKEEVQKEKSPAPEPQAAEPTPNSKTENPDKAADPGPKTADEIIIDLPLNDNTTYAVTQGEINEFSALYPAVDVLQEYRGMKAWCMSNPHKRKTRNGIKKFINGWLANAQKEHQNIVQQTKKPLPDNPFL